MAGILALSACAGVWLDECRGLSARDKQDVVRVAACQGEMEAEYRLGLRYEKGGGKTAPDPERARFWYSLAAQPRENKTLVYTPAPGKGKSTLLSVPKPETPGHAGAQYRLGLLYAQGRGGGERPGRRPGVVRSARPPRRATCKPASC
jgi:TPR repeat protein